MIGVILALVVFKDNKMKEYKLVVPKLGLRNRIQKYEDLLNLYAREGWEVKHIGTNSPTIILERDKNR